jgi:hypothetical protein
MNKIKEKNKENPTQYVGIQFRQKKWVARIKHNAQDLILGRYDNPKDAAKAYDLYVIRHNLDRKTNFFKKKVV